MMNKYILLFFCCFPAIILANTDFNELFEADLGEHIQIADRVATYHTTDVALDIPTQQTELETLQHNIDAMLVTSANEPLYWFISGLNHNNLAALYTAQENANGVTQQIELRNLAYQKAMLLDQTLPLRLSATIYATMKYGLPAADKIKAIKNEISQGGSGDNDSQYIQLHWSQVNALEKSGRHDEAQLALKEMQREINRLDLKNPDYQLIVNRAQKEINQGRAAEEKKTADQQSETKKTILTSNPSKPFNKNILWVIFFAALALVSAWMIVRAIRSK